MLSGEIFLSKVDCFLFIAYSIITILSLYSYLGAVSGKFLTPRDLPQSLTSFITMRCDDLIFDIWSAFHLSWQIVLKTTTSYVSQWCLIVHLRLLFWIIHCLEFWSIFRFFSKGFAFNFRDSCRYLFARFST